MSRLVLVRHAESTSQLEHRYTGSSDVQLTERGREQAAQLGRWAKSAGLDGVWSSPLQRALDTARPAADVTGLELRVDARLRELDFGAAEGRTLEELERGSKQQVDAFRSAPVDNHLPEGEDPRDAVRRGLECLQEIGGQHPNGRVLVVLHNTLLRLTLCQMLGIPLNDYRRLFPLVRNCSLTEVRLRGGHTALLQFNSPIGGLEFRS